MFKSNASNKPGQNSVIHRVRASLFVHNLTHYLPLASQFKCTMLIEKTNHKIKEEIIFVSNINFIHWNQNTIASYQRETRNRDESFIEARRRIDQIWRGGKNRYQSSVSFFSFSDIGFFFYYLSDESWKKMKNRTSELKRDWEWRVLLIYDPFPELKGNWEWRVKTDLCV